MYLFLILLMMNYQGDSTAHHFAKPDDMPKICPVIDASLGCLMGGSEDLNVFLPDSCAKYLKGGETYKLYSLKGYFGEVSLSKPDTYEGACEETYSYNYEEIPESEYNLLGIICNWDPLPRVPKKMNQKKSKYKKIVANFLKEMKMKQWVKIQQVYEIDLEGDGNMETIISATKYSKDEFPEVVVGDYSFVLLLRKEGEMTEKILLLGDFIHNEEEVEGMIPYYNTLHSIADINGDGVLDIIVNSRYYEGEYSLALAFIDGELQQIMGCGCGL